MFVLLSSVRFMLITFSLEMLPLDYSTPSKYNDFGRNEDDDGLVDKQGISFIILSLDRSKFFPR